MQAEKATGPKAWRLSATLATIAIAGTAYFVVVIAAMHFLSPDIDPVQRPTSEYAVGPFGCLMTSAFISLSLGTWALVIGLHGDLSHAGLHRAGLWVLAVWGAGLLVAAAFPIDLDGAPQTLAGTIHAINGPVAFFSLTLGTNLVSRGFKQDVRWRPIHRFASALALLMIAEFVAAGLTAARETGAGIAQRVFIVTFATWFLVVAARLRSNVTQAVVTRAT
jgi:hypothetical protein